MSNHSIVLDVDDKIRTEAAKILADSGLSISEVVQLLLTRIAEEKIITFDPLIPNSETIAAMNDAREGRVKSCDTIEQLFKELNAPD